MMKSRLALAALALLLLVCLATAMPGRRSKSHGQHRGGPNGKLSTGLGRERGQDLDPDSRESPEEKLSRSSSVGTRHHGRHESRKLSRGRRSTGIYDLLNRAGQWSYYIFQHFLPNLDCSSLKARAADPTVAAGIAQACQGLGVQQHCSDINQKRQLPRSSPDVNCDVRTLAQVVYDNCCNNMYQPPRIATTQPPLYSPYSQSVSCGRYMRRPLPRIVDGVPAVQCEFPWMAGLFKDQFIVNCGTSVVSQNYVATAAHCVKEEAWRYQVQAGKHFLDSRMDSSLQLRNVKRIIRHPDYTMEGMEFDDIALLELDRPLEFNECVQPICLPEPGDSPLDFQACTVAGWGVNSSKANLASQPDELQRVELTVYSAQTCRNTFRKDHSVVRDTMLCAANGLVGGKDACTGDSGGPLMCLKDNNRWVLQGIVSMGYGCALAGEPGYYTLVSHYRRWLDTYLNARFQG